MLRTVLVMIGLLLASAAPAQAVERFVGVLEDGRLAYFTSQNPYALSPIVIRGLLPGERLVALSLAPSGSGLVGVGSSARLYAIRGSTRRATPIGPPFAQGLRGMRFSLATAPGSPRARLLSDVGQDLVIDLRTGATEPGPGLRRADDGAVVRPAADLDRDGRLVGWQVRPETLLTETAPGAGTMTAKALDTERVPNLGEPIAFQLGSDGRGYGVAVLSDQLRFRQSAMVIVDPATGELVGDPASRNPGADNLYFGRRVVTFAAVGQTVADRWRPRFRIRLPRRVSVRELLQRRLPLRIECFEACGIVASLSAAGRRVGMVCCPTSDVPGRVGPIVPYIDRNGRVDLRRAVGRHLRVSIRVHDHKRNDRRITRTARLVP